MDNVVTSLDQKSRKEEFTKGRVRNLLGVIASSVGTVLLATVIINTQFAE